MEKSTAVKLRKVYGVILSVLTVIVGALFIMQVLRIYDFGADSPFSRESVGLHLKQIAIPSVLWIAAVIGGAVIWMIFPAEKKSAKPSAAAVYDKLSKKLPQEYGEGFEESARAIEKRNTAIKILWGITLGAGIISAIICVIYLANVNNFPSHNLNREVIAMIACILPGIAVTFIMAVVSVIYEESSARSVLPHVKLLIAASARGGFLPKDTRELIRHKTALLWTVRGIVFAVAVTFIILGALNGGAGDVLAKAIAICTECIGLG